MSQHPIAPQRFKRPRNWLVPCQIIHNLEDRQHCRDCQRCKTDLERREQEKARLAKEEAEAYKSLHQCRDPNHREKCSRCKEIWDRHVNFQLKGARKEAIDASWEARNEWRAPLELGLRTYRAFRAPNPPSSVLFLLPGKNSPVAPTRTPSPEVAVKVFPPTPGHRSGAEKEPTLTTGRVQRTASQRSHPRKTTRSSNLGSSALSRKKKPTETSTHPTPRASSIHPRNPSAAPQAVHTTPPISPTPRTTQAQLIVPASPPSPSPAPRVPLTTTTPNIRRSVAGNDSEQFSKKRFHRDFEQDGYEVTDSTPPAPTRRRTSPTSLHLDATTGVVLQQSSRKRTHSDLERDDLELTPASTSTPGAPESTQVTTAFINTPRIPGQFSPGPLFIRDPEVAIPANHSFQDDNNTSPAMSVLGTLSNFAGQAIWNAASTIGRRIGYAPTNNAGQQVAPDEAHQSPKRRRTDETSTPAHSNVRVEVNSEDEHMELSSPLNNGMVNRDGTPPTNSYSFPFGRTHVSSSASNAAKRALNRYPRTRTFVEPRRRIPEAWTKDTPELATDDSLEPAREQIMPGSWVSEPDEQSLSHSPDLSSTRTSPSTQGKFSDSYNKNSATQDPLLRRTKSPPKYEAFYTQSTTQVRGAWVKSPQAKPSSTEVSDQTSSPISNRSEQPEENTTRNGGIITSNRSDPEPKFKNRAEFFNHDDDFLNIRIGKLDINEKKIRELDSQKEERRRVERAKREAEEKAREEERLRQEAKKLDARLRELGLRKPKRKMITPLSDEWEQKVEYSMTKSNVTCAPPEAVTMTPRDFNRMVRDGQWLNDSCVQAALTELATAINKSAGRVLKQDTPKCVALGTFFWTTLCDKGPENKERMMKRTWGMTPLNFLDIETIIMPINEHSHWTFILIRPKRREVAYVDSFGGSGAQKIPKALRFIEVFLGSARWNSKEWKVIPDLRVPEQHNGFDCGVFVITNSICIALGIDPNIYKESDLPLQRRRIAAALLNGGFKGEFDLKDL